MTGMAPARALAEAQAAPAGWCTVLRSQRTHRRTAVVARGGANAVSASGRAGRSQASFRSSSATLRPRRRDGTRGRAAERHPAPAGPRGSRDYFCLPTRNRQRRDRRCRPRPSCTSDTGGGCPGFVGRVSRSCARPRESSWTVSRRRSGKGRRTMPCACSSKCCAGAAADQVVSESVGFRLNDRGGRFSVQAL